MKLFTLTALLIFGATADDAMALTVKRAEILNKATNVAIREVDFQGAKRHVLTDLKGISLYTFDLDTSDVSNCKAGCLNVWPTFKTAEGDRFEAPYAAIQGNDGKTQLTLKGLPLYYFVQDQRPGDVFGHYPQWQLIFVEE